MTDGIINVNKEKGFTSHDVVAKLRGILHIKKIGHTGTLDPDATGVLPICVGRATKVCELLTDHDKTYEAVVALGITTDTLDTTGEVLSRRPVEVTRERLEEVLTHFRGEIRQVPPMYSAIKINGKKLYEYAREGKEVERKERVVTIHELTLLDAELDAQSKTHDEAAECPTFTIRVTCSKGTYIRTLCDDIGRELGCGAAMASLVRTAVGRFVIDEAMTLAEIEQHVADGDIDTRMLPLESVFADCPACQVTEDAMKLLRNGNPLAREVLTPMAQAGGSDSAAGAAEAGAVSETAGVSAQADMSRIRVYGTDGDFYALYIYNKNKKKYIVEKFFHV
ncbi:MAG: tRNA pseudouridine(55) synthase TruB [Eubacterium sp.]|nr:tRNA pseudouridine(55) synthase TruB [Eubacterium sp.]